MEEEFLNLGFLDDSAAAEILNFGDEVEDDTTTEEVEETTETNESEPTEEVVEETEETETPESVDNEELQETKKNTSTEKSSGSPSQSSIALAFKEAGVLQTLDDDVLKAIDSDDALAEAFEQEVQNRLDAHTRSVSEALKYRVPIPVIQQYEENIKVLNGVTNEQLENEDEQGENVRKNLIYQNYINKGFSQEDALDMVNRSVESGHDIDDAKKALQACKSYYTKAYEDLKNNAKKEYEENQRKIKEQAKELKDSILNDDEVFSALEINKSSRQKIYDTVSKVVETDENGVQYTAIQKYIKDNPIQFWKNVGMFFTLTDGFENIGSLIDKPVKTKVKKNNEKLIRVLNSTVRDDNGALKLQGGVSANNEALDLNNWKLS